MGCYFGVVAVRWRRDSNPCIRLCRPLPRLSATPPWVTASRYQKAVTRADDEIRTRDPHLGKVMRYHCATSAFCFPLPGRIETLAHIFADGQTGTLVVADAPRPRRKPLRLCGKMVSHGRLAQLVARFLHTEEVISSSLVSPTTTYSLTRSIGLPRRAGAANCSPPRPQTSRRRDTEGRYPLARVAPRNPPKGMEKCWCYLDSNT